MMKCVLTIEDNWKNGNDFGKSEIGFQNGIQRDVMCSFRKSTFSNQEDPKAQYQN